ncbi:hypothetical protein CXF95_05000 [Paraglaciecola sp. MB-3u-78]|nr:hypothetical protein CXF95_05000 [Paraglaciecola sp. MB-3u-78]
MHISVNITLLTFSRIGKTFLLGDDAIDWECSGQKHYIRFRADMNCVRISTLLFIQIIKQKELSKKNHKFNLWV